MSNVETQRTAGAAAAAEVTGTPTARLKAYVTEVADWLERDGDYCTDAMWAEKLAYLRGYVGAAKQDVA